MMPSILAGLLLVPPALSAQRLLPPMDEYHVRAFTPSDGLPVSEVRGVVQDGSGHLYVEAGRGVVRFDGLRFSRVALDGFTTPRMSWLADAAGPGVWAVSENDEVAHIRAEGTRMLPAVDGRVLGASRTPDGRVWIGTTRGLLMLDSLGDRSYERFGVGHGLPADTVLGLLNRPTGNAYVVTVGGIARLKGSAGVEPWFQRVGPAFRSGVYELPVRTAAAAGTLWVHAGDDAALVHRGDEWRRWSAVEPDPLRPLLPRNGTEMAWLGRATHLLHSPGTVAGIQRHFLLARDGTRWLVVRRGSGGAETRDRLFLDRGGGWEERPLGSGAIRGIEALLEDHEGSIWVGTDRGLFQLAPRRVAALPPGPHLAAPFTTAVLQTSDQRVWVGTWGGGLHGYGDHADWITPEEGLPTSRVRSLYESSDGTLWVGTRAGAAAIVDGRVVARSDPGVGEVRDFAEARDRAGWTLWVAGDGQLYTCTCDGPGSLQPAGAATLPLAPYRPDIDWGREIWALHRDRAGRIWVGGTDGLFRIEGDRVDRVGAEDGFRGRVVSSIQEDADGTLWVSTYSEGLYRLRNGRFAVVTTAEGLHHNGVWRMLHDDRGGVWMSSDGGIFRVERVRLDAVLDAVERGDTVIEPLDPLVFTEAEGLPSAESNRAAPAGWRLHDGRLVFNNIAGLVAVEPSRALQSLPPPRTVLRSVVADGTSRPTGPAPGRRLPAGVRHLEIEYAALSFAAPQQNRYRFRLDGFDEDWVIGGTNARTSYTGLRPGRYTFRVQGAAGTGRWGPTASYAFVIPPLFWQSFWFRLLIGIAVLGLLSLAYRLRVRRLLELERLRLRIASDLHDDVGSNLSSIALLTEMLQDQPDGSLDSHQLERIRKTAGETIGALREIIWLVDPEHDNLPALVRRMRATGRELLHGTPLEFVVTPDLPEIELDPFFVRPVFMLYKETLHNALKHSSASRIRVEVAVEGRRMVLRVEDDGEGFESAAVTPGRGLASMRRRARQLGGELVVHTAPGAGTTVVFTVRMA